MRLWLLYSLLTRWCYWLLLILESSRSLLRLDNSLRYSLLILDYLLRRFLISLKYLICLLLSLKSLRRSLLRLLKYSLWCSLLRLLRYSLLGLIYPLGGLLLIL